jgi:hypothetical protein
MIHYQGSPVTPETAAAGGRMNATIHRIRAGSLPHIDCRAACRNEREAHEALRDAADSAEHFARDPAYDEHGHGGAVVYIVGLAVLMPMAVWGVVALVRHLVQN